MEIREQDAAIGLTPERWDDSGNRIADIPDQEFQQLLDSVKGKTRFNIDLECNGKMRRVRSPICGEKDRDFVLSRVISQIVGLVISKQFDNLCQAGAPLPP